MEYLNPQNALRSFQFRLWIQKCHLQENQHWSVINDVRMQIMFKLSFNQYMKNCKLKLDRVTHYKRKVQIEDVFPD